MPKYAKNRYLKRDFRFLWRLLDIFVETLRNEVFLHRCKLHEYTTMRRHFRLPTLMITAGIDIFLTPEIPYVLRTDHAERTRNESYLFGSEDKLNIATATVPSANGFR